MPLAQKILIMNTDRSERRNKTWIRTLGENAIQNAHWIAMAIALALATAGCEAIARCWTHNVAGTTDLDKAPAKPLYQVP